MCEHMLDYFYLFADTELFPALSDIYMIVALTGLFRRVRNSEWYFPIVFICLLSMPVLYGIGYYFLSHPSLCERYNDSMSCDLTDLANRNLFGWLSFIYLIVALTGLFRRVRGWKWYFPIAFVCLLFMLVLHTIAYYYLSRHNPCGNNVWCMQNDFFYFLVNSNLFTSLALICLIVALAGLFRRARGSKQYSPIVFACLLFMPVLYIIGCYYLSHPNPCQKYVMCMQRTLAVLADSNLFGCLSFISLIAGLAGLFPRVRGSKRYFPIVFACLLFMPVLYVIGCYYLTHP